MMQTGDEAAEQMNTTLRNDVNLSQRHDILSLINAD